MRRLRLFAAALLLCSVVAGAASDGFTATPSGLKYRVVAEGTGPAVKKGQSVRIHETTTLEDGTLIFSTRTRNKPLKFLVGGNQVIAGVDEAVVGMKVGERRKLIVPPSLSKRSTYPSNVPPNAVLHYDLEVVEIVGP